MTIYKYELKQLRNSMLIWSFVLGILIFFMLPVYIGMFTSTFIQAGGNFSDNAFFELIGTNIEILTSPLGAYSFLTTFVLIAVAIFSMQLGVGSITREYANWTADFLLTKPHSRSKIFFSKLFAAVSAVLIVSIVYFLVSWAGMISSSLDSYSFRVFSLIALNVLLIQLIFLPLGMLTGVLFPHIGNPLMVSTGVAFITYVLASFSRKVNIALVGYLSPYIYFDSFQTIIHNGYRRTYLVLFLVFTVALILTGHHLFCKKDVLTAA